MRLYVKRAGRTSKKGSGVIHKKVATNTNIVRQKGPKDVLEMKKPQYSSDLTK